MELPVKENGCSPHLPPSSVTSVRELRALFPLQIDMMLLRYPDRKPCDSACSAPNLQGIFELTKCQPAVPRPGVHEIDTSQKQYRYNPQKYVVVSLYGNLGLHLSTLIDCSVGFFTHIRSISSPNSKLPRDQTFGLRTDCGLWLIQSR